MRISMTESRIAQFDYIRVMSLLGILICHSLLESYSFGWLGRYFAMTFNFLFLILSAFLLGMAWEAKGFPKYNVGYFWKRVAKLSRSYYPFLVILFTYLFFTEDYFSIPKIASHFAYLPWFDKLNGFGHLWFLTMIVVCYLFCYLVSKVGEWLSVKLNYLYISLLCLWGLTTF